MVKRESKSSRRDQNKDGQFPEGENCGSSQDSAHPSSWASPSSHPHNFFFYSYRNVQNALYKKLAFIFTIHMPVESSPSLSPNEGDGSVQKYLLQWCLGKG